MNYNPSCKIIEPVDNTLASELYERILARQPLIFFDSNDYELFDRMMMNVVSREAKKAEKGLVPLVKANRIFEYVPSVGTVTFADKSVVLYDEDEEKSVPDVRSLYHFLFEREYAENDVLVIRGGTRLFEDAVSHTDVVDWIRMMVGNSLNDKRLACVEEETDDGPKTVQGCFLTIIFVGADISIPNALIPYSARLKRKELSETQIRSVVESEIALIEKRRGSRLTFGVDFKDRNDSEKIAAGRKGFVSEMLPRLKGFSEMEIRQLLRFASQGQDFNAAARKKIENAKREMVERTGYLKLVEVDRLNKGDNDPPFAGLENLVDHFRRTRKLSTLSAETLKVFNGNGLKGVLLVGMPGCGKSMAAKAAGQILGWPVIGLDVGRLLGKYVGESERNLRLALDIADRAAPCVLWIDELEKAFSGLESSDGTAMRLFGAFLTWLQDKKTLVYVIATANNVDKIPDEFKRKGRFDAIFSILLPNAQERAQIFKFHLKKMLSVTQFDGVRSELDTQKKWDSACEELARGAAGKDDDGRAFSGADIAAVVNTSVADVLVEQREKSDPITWQMLRSCLDRNVKHMKEQKTTQRDLMTAHVCVGSDGQKTNVYELSRKCLTSGGYRSASKDGKK